MIYTIKVFLLLSILFTSSFTAQPPPRQLYFENETVIWLGTDQGLKRYQAENELWTTILPGAITDQCYDDDVLWVGTANGIFYADLRYLDWKKYTAEDGLPSDSIVRIAADLDFIYVAGINGLARFDKLVQQWESFGDFSSKKIYDIYSDQDFLWVATDAGIFYFEKQYEKWKQYTDQSGLASNLVYRIFYFNDYLWILTDKGFSRYNAGMKTWNSYNLNTDIPGSAVTYLWTDAEYIWTITPEKVIRYSGKNQTWEDFSLNTPIEKLTIYSLSTTGKNSWFATSDGVFSFQEEQRRWTTYTAIEGLSDDIQENILCIGQSIICKKENTFSVYFPAEDLWHAKEAAGAEGKGAVKEKWDFYDDERGLGFKTPGGRSTSLLGRAYFKLKNKADFPAPIDQSIKDYIFNNNLDSIYYDSVSKTYDTIARFKDYLYWWPKAQLNLNVDLKNGRTIRGSYDNTDPLGSVPYGLEYRGYGDDYLKKAGWLYNQKTDYFNSTLIDPTYIEGASIRTEAGSRVGEKKRRRVNTGAWAGWRKTEYLKKLIPFEEGNFYTLNVNNIITESVEIKVDGKVVDPREYSIERTKGLLTFKNEGFVTPDSRIEISLEYEPEIGGHTSEMAAMENVVVFNDALSIGVNGAGRQFNDYDREGTGTDKNQLGVGSINSKIDLKSKNGKVTFKAMPEVSTSYNDSILVEKQGTAGKLGINTSIYNLRLRGQAQLFTSEYETLADITSIYGRVNHQGEADATYDITEYMPVTAGFSLVDAAAGKENKQYFEYLFSPSGLPSIKLQGLHQSIFSKKRSNPRTVADSIQTERWNGRIETEWDISKKTLDILHMQRIWLNASYSQDFISDTLFDSLSDDYEFLQNYNQNIFGWLQISPLKKLSLETRQIFRIFRQNDMIDDTWNKKGNRYRPEFRLFSQELIPGITLNAKFTIENSTDILDPVMTDSSDQTTADSTSDMSKKRLNSNILLIPGVWWSFLNPFQLNLGYNFSKEDSTLDCATSSNTTYTQGFGHTFTINPRLDFAQNVHISNRTELSRQKEFNSTSQQGIKVLNEAELISQDRKTKFLIEYDLTKTIDYFLHFDGSASGDTSTSGFQHDARFKWTQRWLPMFRTELRLNSGWQKADTTIDNNTVSPDYVNIISPGILIDWRIQKKVLREFRLQYYTGASLYDGRFFDYDSYKTSWDNKLDLSLKVGRNFILRLLLNLNYLFDEDLLRYDLTEFKATALF